MATGPVLVSFTLNFHVPFIGTPARLIHKVLLKLRVPCPPALLLTASTVNFLPFGAVRLTSSSAIFGWTMFTDTAEFVEPFPDWPLIVIELVAVALSGILMSVLWNCSFFVAGFGPRGT